MRTHADYVKHLESLAKTDRKIIDDFARDITEQRRDTCHVITWSEGVFEAAARLHVAKLLMCTTSIRGAVDHCEQRVLHGASYPSQSTSQSQNLMKTYMLKSWAEKLDELREEWRFETTDSDTS